MVAIVYSVFFSFFLRVRQNYILNFKESNFYLDRDPITINSSNATTITTTTITITGNISNWILMQRTFEGQAYQSTTDHKSTWHKVNSFSQYRNSIWSSWRSSSLSRLNNNYMILWDLKSIGSLTSSRSYAIRKCQPSSSR